MERFRVQADGCYDRTIEADCMESAVVTYCDIVQKRTDNLFRPEESDCYLLPLVDGTVAYTAKRAKKQKKFNPNQWSERQKNAACGLRTS
jgi:hypothetical protein